MIDIDTFARKSPGAEEAAVLALALVNDLLGLLREKGVLTPNDTTLFLETAANRLSQSPNEVAKRGSRFITDAMLPEHKANKV